MFYHGTDLLYEEMRIMSNIKYFFIMLTKKIRFIAIMFIKVFYTELIKLI